MVKFVQPSPYADPEAAMRKLLEIANSVEAKQEGRIHIEKINGPMLFEHGAEPDEYKAALMLAIERGYLVLAFDRALRLVDRRVRERGVPLPDPGGPKSTIRIRIRSLVGLWADLTDL